MKHIIYEDPEGFRRRVIVRDSDTQAEAAYGIPAGPPDIRLLDWESLLREMNNALTDNNLYTWDDIQRSQSGVMIAASVVRRALIDMYRQAADDAAGKNAPREE